jgi:hypothetical protein
MTHVNGIALKNCANPVVNYTLFLLVLANYPYGKSASGRYLDTSYNRAASVLVW